MVEFRVMKIKTFVLLSFVIASGSVSAANLLLNNANFESTQFQDYMSSAGVYTDAPGWVATVLSPGFAYIGSNTDQGGIGNARFAYAGGNSGRWETATVNRAMVTAATDYTFSYSARRDNATLTAFVLVDWFNSGGGLLSSSTDFGAEVTPTSGTNSAPLVSFSHTVTSPAGATAAGIRWGTTTGGMLADNFFLDVVPEPSSALLGGLGMMTLLVRRRRA